MRDQKILDSNMSLLRFLEKNPNLTLDDVLEREKKTKNSLPFYHGTMHDGKITSGSYLDYDALLKKYSPNNG